MGVVNALLRDGEHALFGEEELLDRPIRRRMSAVRGIAFEMGTVKGRDTTLHRVSLAASGVGTV
jgi:hypothetical protein